MTEIGRRHLAPIVNVEAGGATTDVLRRLDGLDQATRMGSVVVVARPGAFTTFTWVDLARLISEDDTVIDLPLDELLPRVHAVASPAVERVGIGIGDARDLQRAAPRGRLLVLEDRVPVGILMQHLQGGPGFDLAAVDQRLFGARAAMAEPGEEPEAEPRWLSTQVHAGFEERRRSFKAGAVNEISVGIAPRSETLIQPQEELPIPPGATELEVVLRAPGLIEHPMHGTFDVPATGQTQRPARFDLVIPANLGQVQITIDVVYQNRAIQSATLSGPAFGGTDEATPGDARLELLRTVPAGLDVATARPFDALIVVDGETVLANVGGDAIELGLGGIREAAETIQEHLYTTAVAAAHEGESGGEAVRRLLAFLAYHGNGIYRELHDGGLDALDAARTIEVTVRDAGAFFPIEFVYERGTPGEHPELCPNWRAAFQAGAVDCPDCPADGDDKPWVCPLGFWGLSKEIARRIDPRVRDDVAAAAVTSNPSATFPRLPRLTGAVVGASTRVDAAAGATSQIAATVELAGQLLGVGSVIRVDDWPGWRAAVQERRPPLLLAMPHTEIDDEVAAEVLQIGAASNLRSQNVREDCVQLPRADVGPIVLLLGCTTAGPAIGYLGFVPAFLRQHAAVVVGTVAKVLGRQTGPVAQQFLREAVAAQGKDVPLSEVMRRTRGSMLLAGNVMGLTLTAYGNSDWLLAAGPA